MAHTTTTNNGISKLAKRAKEVAQIVGAATILVAAVVGIQAYVTMIAANSASTKIQDAMDANAASLRALIHQEGDSAFLRDSLMIERINRLEMVIQGGVYTRREIDARLGAIDREIKALARQR